MSELFDIPESPLPPLELARRKLLAAEKAANESPSQENDDAVYWAEIEVAKLEAEARWK